MGTAACRGKDGRCGVSSVDAGNGSRDRRVGARCRRVERVSENGRSQSFALHEEGRRARGGARSHVGQKAGGVLGEADSKRQRSGAGRARWDPNGLAEGDDAVACPRGGVVGEARARWDVNVLDGRRGTTVQVASPHCETEGHERLGAAGSVALHNHIGVDALNDQAREALALQLGPSVAVEGDAGAVLVVGCSVESALADERELRGVVHVEVVDVAGVVDDCRRERTLNEFANQAGISLRGRDGHVVARAVDYDDAFELQDLLDARHLGCAVKEHGGS